MKGCIFRNKFGECELTGDTRLSLFCTGGPCNDRVPSNRDRLSELTDEELADEIYYELAQFPDRDSLLAYLKKGVTK